MRKIIHVDMDYFFAQVEELDIPELKLKPFAVGGSYSGKGVVCTSNYVAREYGVKSAMSSYEALKRCPNLILIKPNFEKYKEKSKIIFDIFRNTSSIVQGLSVDEAYIDVTECRLLNNDAVAIAKNIKDQIMQQTGLTASAGVASNKLLAKIGSDLFKPDGLAVLRPEGIESRIRHFPINKISGIGKVTAEKMNKRGIFTFGDLQHFKLADLVNHYGDFGCNLYNYCRGIDHREVNPHRTRKSVSVEHTFFENISKQEDIELKLAHTYEQLLSRLEPHRNRKIKNLFVKIKYPDFQGSTIEAQKELQLSEFSKLFYKRWSERRDPLRLLGLGVRFQTERSIKDQLEFTF